MDLKNNPSQTDGNGTAEDIYDILGIDPEVYSASYNPQDIVKGTPEAADDPGAPSGSIFDNYSNYRDNDPSYWRSYRWLTIAGVAAFIGLGVFFRVSADDILDSIDDCIDWLEDVLEDVIFDNGVDWFDDVVDEVTFDDDVDWFDVDVEETTFREPIFTAEGTCYFSGTIYPDIALEMQIDFGSNSGSYKYTKYGNQMNLVVTSVNRYGRTYEISMSEYNDDWNYTGEWNGVVTAYGDFTGTGEFLGKKRNFELHAVPSL